MVIFRRILIKSGDLGLNPIHTSMRVSPIELNEIYSEVDWHRTELLMILHTHWSIIFTQK